MKYKVIVAPSSEHDRIFEDCNTFEQAESKVGEGVLMYTFNTPEEADAFMQGYEVAIGYLGESPAVTNY